MTRFIYSPLFPADTSKTVYRPLEGGHVTRGEGPGKPELQIAPAALRLLAREAFRDLAFYLPVRHVEQLAAVLDDGQASENERFVARALLRNAIVASEGLLPLCQDTGTATIMAAKGERVKTGGDDVLQLAHGVYDAYTRDALRYSQIIPRSMLEEDNSATNLPAQIDITADRGADYRFCFMAKGAGSANKTRFSMETKALLNSEQTLLDFLKEHINAIGVAACPPYHLAIVIGGLSPDMTLKTVKLASAGFLDGLPRQPSPSGHAYRDTIWENKVMRLCQATELGMQFGGRHFAFEARVIRLPRHAGSVPVGIGVSCNAHRNMRGKITARGLFLEKLERNPIRWLNRLEGETFPPAVSIDLDQPITQIVAALSHCPAGTRVALNGTLIVARDIAHAHLHAMLDAGKPLPDWFANHPVYYAGPAKTPPGKPTGSFGPTTALRMDSYAPKFMAQGASRIMLAKGNRNDAVRQACRQHNGFYLATIGGAAALVADQNIRSSVVVAFPELGMEAVRKITVRDLPAFVVYDNQGRTLY